MKTKGKVTGIISNIVIVKTEGPVAQNEIATVKLGEVRMMAEVIKVVGDDAYIQVFDSTRGLRMGAEVEFEGHMLEATLGPGILSKNYDGLQNDLADMDGLFIRRGQRTSPLNEETLWEFRPLAKPGDRVEAGDWLGEVKEQWIMHKIMVPFAFEGSYTVRSVAGAGEYNINHTVAVLEDAQGGEHPVTMVQKWPVKRPIKAYVSKPRPSRILETGVRPIDTFNPIADGGTGFIPGPFGAGKTVLQHAIAKQAEADIIIMIACGERANEVVEIFAEFPHLDDPHTGHKLMERTTIICNTSNMPVASARGVRLYGNDHRGVLPGHGAEGADSRRLHLALGAGAARDEQPSGRASGTGRLSDGPLGRHIQFLRPCRTGAPAQRCDGFGDFPRYGVAGGR